jgi:tripartite-type tricarboxylate transporter receptor subunit TctC
MKRRDLLLGVSGGLALATLGSAGYAQSNPQSRPIRLVAPISTGGATDFLARFLAERLTPILGQPVVVENRPGAGGTIGARYVAAAPPDGHTLLMSTIGFQAVAPALYKNLPYDPDTAFAPVIQTIANQQILVVRNELPVKDVAGLVALARQKPGALTYASAGVGSVLHLAMEYLKFTAGIELRHIPYNGSGKMVVALVAQEVDAAMPDGPSSLPLIQEGRLRAIAVTGPHRAQGLPNVPTCGEWGSPGFNVRGGGGVRVPSGTAARVVA